MQFLKKFALGITIHFCLLLTHSAIGQNNSAPDYSAIIKQADQYYAAGDYIKAKTSYEYALRMRPEETYPKNQLDKVLKKLREQMMVMEQYSAVISEADKLFWMGKYEDAKAKYTEASRMVPNEGYPKQKLTEIEEVEATERRRQVAVDDAIYRAERFEKYRKYDEAIAQYEKVLELTPADQTIVDKIAVLRITSVEFEHTKTDYDVIISNADRLFDLNFYAEAGKEYQRAADAKPDEDYPRQQLEMIKPLLEKKNKFDDLVEKGDELYMEKDYAGSLKNYEAALKIFPDESYPLTMIERVRDAIAVSGQTAASGKTIETAGDKPSKEEVIVVDPYEEAIEVGNRLFGLQDYEEAKLAYLRAANIRPEEKYPRDKMKEIDDILYSRDSQEATFNRLVSAGDRMFESEEYEKAQQRYTEALQLIPGRTYPLEQLKEIDKKVLERELNIQKAYNEAIDNADALMSRKEFSKARIAYQNALKIKPDERYPVQQMASIDMQLDDLGKLQTEYMRLVGEADQLFTSREYQKAKEKYIEASAIFPDEVHPKNRIESINLINRGSFETSNKEYDKAISDADKFLAGGVYDQALNSYRKALALMPDEYYPAQMIERIMKILDDNAMRRIVTSSVVIENNQQKNFDFEPLGFGDRRNSILFIKAKCLSDNDFRIILGYGRGNSKKGGVTIPVQKDLDINEYIIEIGKQYPWTSEENNFISLTPQGGSVEITLMEISKGE